MNKKRLLVVILSMLLCSLCLAFVGCGKPKVHLELNLSELSVEKYDNAWILAECDNPNDLVWSVADSSIATVEKGKVTGVGVGQTEVSATLGQEKRVCKVTVTPAKAEKLAITVAESSFSMYIGDTKAIVPSVTYDNIPISGAAFTFATEGTNVTVDEAGVVTASALGQATVTVSSTVDGKVMSASVTVNVVSSQAVEIQQTNVVLYPLEEYAGIPYNKTIQCDVEVTDKGQVITPEAGSIAWSVPANQDVATVSDNGLVTALNTGEVTLTATYTPENGTPVQHQILITVSTVAIEVENYTLELGKSTSFTPDVEALVGISGERAIKLVANGDGIEDLEILPEQGAFSVAELASGSASITIVTRNFSFTFNAKVFDGVIASVQEMKGLLTATSGYYKLVADIDMAEYTDNGGIWASNTTFAGTIDGGEHIIKNFKTSTGLFKSFNGTISDLAFVNVIPAGNAGVIASGYVRTGVSDVYVTNVYASLAKPASTCDWYFGFFGLINPGSPVTFTNSIMIDKASSGRACFIGRFGSVAMSFDNAIIVGGTEYMGSLNSNLSAEAQKALHLPESIKDTYKKFADVNEFEQAFANVETGFTEFINNVIASDKGNGGNTSSAYTITSANIAELLTATEGDYVLGEDIDMSTAYTANGGVWESTLSFQGTLDGNGHTISNLKTSTGLFAVLGAKGGTVTIKNLALKNVQTSGQVGALAKTLLVNDKLTINIQNVYVEHSGEPAWGGGGLFGRSPRLGDGGTKMNITNSVVCINGANGGSYGALSHTLNDAYGLTISNCYFAGANGVVVVSANVALPTTGYTAYATVSDLKTAYGAGSVTGLSDFIKDIIEG